MKHISLIAGACAVFVSVTGICHAVSVVNPSFETPVEPGGSGTVIEQGAGSSSALPGWSILSTGGIFAINNDRNDPSNAFVNQDGNQYLVDVSIPGEGYSGGGTVSQILTTSFAAGTSYDLYVWAGNASGSPAQLGDSIFIANSSGTVLAFTSLDTAPTNGSLVQFSLDYTSTGLLGDTGPIEIGFTGAAQNSSSVMAVDDFQLGIVLPEPNSLAVAVLGGVVCCIQLAFARRTSL